MEARWNRIQVGRQGAYSIERAESLDHYCKTTSRTRAFLVCILTPIPALSILILQEFLPLRSPSEGWKANWVFWIRLSIMGFPIIYVGIAQLVIFVPGLNVTFNKVLLASLSATAVFVGVGFIEAVTIGFPAPFVAQLAGSCVGIIFPPLIRLVVGPRPFSSDSPCLPYLQQFCRFIIAYITLVVVFPVYKVLYDWLPAAYQGCAIIALTIWKFGAKHFIMHATRKLEDFIPEIVALSVDIISALFVSVCISTSGSVYLTAAFITVDVLQIMMEFKEVRGNAKVVLTLLRDHRMCINLESKSSTNAQSSELLVMILAIAQDPLAFGIRSIDSARLKACIPHPISSGQAKILQELEVSGVYCGQDSITTTVQSSYHTVRVQSSSVKSMLADVNAGSKREPLDHGQQSKQFIVQGLQLLFHCEYLALVEYVECIVPLIFITYKSALEHLPNIVYFPGGGGNWTTHAAANVMASAVLEIISFAMFHLLLQRKFSFSPLYQLAFVLETQMITVQSKLVFTILVLLQYQLEHLGVDFTFRFKWLD